MFLADRKKVFYFKTYNLIVSFQLDLTIIINGIKYSSKCELIQKNCLKVYVYN